MARLIIGILFIAVWVRFAPAFSRYDPMQTDPNAALQPPNAAHLLGTDLLGRDVLSRLLHGGQNTLLMALTATTIAAGIGSLWGVAAGFIGGGVDRLSSMVVNALLAIPGLILGFMLLMLLPQEGGIWNTAIAVGTSQIAPFVQVARATAMQIRNEPYVEGAYAIGAPTSWILLHTVLPNVLPVLLAYANVTFGYCILNAAAFGFLGLSGTTLEWGVMLAEGREIIREAPWVSAAPGLAITLLVYAVNRLVAGSTRRR